MGVSRSSTAPSWRKEALARAADLTIPANLHSSSAVVPSQELHQYKDNDIGVFSVVHTEDDSSRPLEASATETRSHATSLQVRSLPIALPSVTPTPVNHQPLLCTGGDGETQTINLRPSAHIGGTEDLAGAAARCCATSPTPLARWTHSPTTSHWQARELARHMGVPARTAQPSHPADAPARGLQETLTQSDEGESLISAPGADHTARPSEEGVDESEGVKWDRSALTTKSWNAKNELRTHTGTVGLAGLDALPLIVAEGMMAQIGDEARLPSRLVHPQTHIPGFPYDLDMGAGQEGMQGDFSMDEDEDESEPSFGVLSNTTFDPSHSYRHGLNIEQGGLIVEDVETEFVADSVMEDVGMEYWKAEASVTTETLQPFSWLPPPVFGAPQAIFPNVPSTQMTTFVNPAMHVLAPPMLSEPYAMGSTVPKGGTLQQVAPLQDIPYPFVSDGTHPLRSVEGELFEGPEYIVPKLSNIPSLNVSASHTSSRSSFPLTSPTVSRAGPIPFPPFIRRHIEQRNEEGVDLDEEMDPKLGVAAGVQHEASPLRCVLILEIM